MHACKGKLENWDSNHRSWKYEARFRNKRSKGRRRRKMTRGRGWLIEIDFSFSFSFFLSVCLKKKRERESWYIREKKNVVDTMEEVLKRRVKSKKKKVWLIVFVKTCKYISRGNYTNVTAKMKRTGCDRRLQIPDSSFCLSLYICIYIYISLSLFAAEIFLGRRILLRGNTVY